MKVEVIACIQQDEYRLAPNNGNVPPVYADVPDEVGERWVALGLALKAKGDDDADESKPKGPVETAALKQPEVATGLRQRANPTKPPATE